LRSLAITVNPLITIAFALIKRFFNDRRLWQDRRVSCRWCYDARHFRGDNGFVVSIGFSGVGARVLSSAPSRARFFIFRRLRIIV
jgi:cytochrome c peroxidase